MPPRQTFPNPGTCQAGTLDSNHSESWIAVQPGTENLAGSSTFFFDKYSKFYDHYLGSCRILNGKPVPSYYRVIRTRVPSGTLDNRCNAAAGTRTHPLLTAWPNADGSGQPCRPTVPGPPPKVESALE